MLPNSMVWIGALTAITKMPSEGRSNCRQCLKSPSACRRSQFIHTNLEVYNLGRKLRGGNGLVLVVVVPLIKLNLYVTSMIV
jgi:hypothetical protein